MLGKTTGNKTALALTILITIVAYAAGYVVEQLDWDSARSVLAQNGLAVFDGSVFVDYHHY